MQKVGGKWKKITRKKSVNSGAKDFPRVLYLLKEEEYMSEIIFNCEHCSVEFRVPSEFGGQLAD